ncbi:MAG: dipeptidase, partial [Ignavibacteriales bacterium]|nr:dipeptidase [Ignavibacteriales bacterium]
PTVLFYGHYDVMPVDPIDEWKTKPFEPTIKDGKIWGRGTTDDKGQLYMHVAAVDALMKTRKTLPVNVKFVLEGEEEIGSEALDGFLKKQKKLLKCDAVVVSDTSLYADNTPTVTYGLRGLAALEGEVQGPKGDLHSGSFGGAVANPANTLAQMIAKLHDKDGKVAIPGFYKKVKPLTKSERENIKKLRHSETKLARELGVRELHGENKFAALERIWARPTLDVNGIKGGFIEEGFKTIIPAKASAKISMRLVPDQDPIEIGKLAKKHIESIAPRSVRVNVEIGHSGPPALAPLDSKPMKAASKAIAEAFGKKKTVFNREGGSIPIIAAFADQLKAPVVMMGLGLNSENLHAPNEHFSLKNFERGIVSSILFMDEMAK